MYVSIAISTAAVDRSGWIFDALRPCIITRRSSQQVACLPACVCRKQVSWTWDAPNQHRRYHASFFFCDQIGSHASCNRSCSRSLVVHHDIPEVRVVLPAKVSQQFCAQGTRHQQVANEVNFFAVPFFHAYTASCCLRVWQAVLSFSH